MKTLQKPTLLFLLIVSLVSSCVLRSLHPLYTKSELIIDNRLEGSYIVDETDTWNITKADNQAIENGDKLYHLEHIQNGDTVIFDLFLVKLDKYLYLDFFIDEYKSKPLENEFAAFHLYPVHSFAKVSFDGNQIIINPFNSQYLGKLIEQNRIRISHEMANEDILLTASPEELQKFVIKYSDDENIFEEESFILKRKG
ncbi:hypothetical protein KZP23_05880 [Echinicola marina]|uniref:hypothetical protein n=1 Tax=Echinicola marina TaxID=2859768 RepID=UPI001CF65ABE|nr:hypothetical protein [Echinicola marina]UCS94549.1 hypothetical protein KZP23_05880 [Echinicola marina]